MQDKASFFAFIHLFPKSLDPWLVGLLQLLKVVRCVIFSGFVVEADSVARISAEIQLLRELKVLIVKITLKIRIEQSDKR